MYADFDVIEIFDEGGSYPILLEIGWDDDSLAMINFKQHVMTFENRNIRFIAPTDPSEGRRNVEPVKEEVVGGWDHVYNISKEISSSTSLDSDDALEN